MCALSGCFRCGFKKFLFTLFLALCPILGIVCDRASFAQAPIIKNIQVAPPERKGMTNKDMQDICTAALSTMFGKPASVIMAEGQGMMYLSFPQTPRQYKCRIAGNKVLWAATDEPWPAENSADQVSFQLTPDEILLTIQFPDGTEKESSFHREQKNSHP